MTFRRLSSLARLSSVLIVGACNDISAPISQPSPDGIARSSGGGGKGTTVSGVSILPTTPPAPGVLIRESFGMANGQRPASGKGDLKDVHAHVTIRSFWVEYPGSKNTQWLAPDVGQTWKFCAGDNPWEMPSPLQPSYGGCVASEWFDPPTSYPTALLPITVALPNAGYELSMEGYPAPIPGAYIAIGFTNSSALTSNLTTSGSLWLRVTDTTRYGVPLHYELRTGSLASGRLIASGDAGASSFNRMAIRYSPTAGTVTLSFDGTVVGTYPVSIPTPRYLAFEGVGILDNLVLRQ
jgi:hypothetical protein